MANFGKLLITNIGFNEQYKAQSGAYPLKFKRIALGSGNYTGNWMARTSLVNEKVSVSISRGYLKNNAYIVEGFFSNEGLNTGFEWREIGVFVEDENGNDILYCYANAGDSSDYIPATADELYTKSIRIAMSIGNATNVTFAESEGFIYVDLKTHDADMLSLRTDIDQLWPSKAASGSAIVVEGSGNLPFVGFNIYGKSTQIETNGYQLFDSRRLASKNAEGFSVQNNGDGSFTISGSGALANNFDVARTVYTNEEVLKLLKVGRLTVKAERVTSPYFYVALIDGNGDIINEATNRRSVSQSIDITASLLATEGLQLRVGFYGPSGDTVTAGTIKPMLYIDGDGTWEQFSGGAPSPSPEYPQEIMNVGDNGSVNVEVYSKNLLSYPYQMTTLTANGLTFTDNGDGSITVNGTATTTTYFQLNNLPKVNGKLIVSGCPARGSYATYSLVIDKNGEWYSTDYGDGIVIDCDDSYTYGLVITIRRDSIVSNITFYPQVELYNDNDAATSYEKHKAKQILTLSTSNGLAGIPVSSGGNYTDENGQAWICDKIDLERGVELGRIKKIVLNGTEGGWYLNGSASNGKTRLYQLPYTNYEGNKKSLPAALCTHSMHSESTFNSDESCFCIYNSSNKTYIRIRSDASDLDGFKSFLSQQYAAGTPVTVYYDTGEESETALTASEIAAYQALHSNNPTTTIFNDSGAGMNVQYITEAQEPILKKIIPKLNRIDDELGALLGDGTKGLKYSWNNGAFECTGNGTASEEHITIPHRVCYLVVNSIGSSAFSNIKTIKSVTIPAGDWSDMMAFVQSIGQNAFSNCSNLENVSMHGSVSSIGSYAFASCTSLKSIELPYSLKTIESSTFQNCTSLKSVTIPAGVTSIKGSAFALCSGLTDVYYKGTETQWNAITIATGNDYLKNATIHYNS